MREHTANRTCHEHERAHHSFSLGFDQTHSAFPTLHARTHTHLADSAARKMAKCQSPDVSVTLTCPTLILLVSLLVQFHARNFRLAFFILKFSWRHRCAHVVSPHEQTTRRMLLTRFATAAWRNADSYNLRCVPSDFLCASFSFLFWLRARVAVAHMRACLRKCEVCDAWSEK